MHKNAFSPRDAFKKYLTQVVVTHHTFRECIHLPSIKWLKNIDKRQCFREISHYENINFVLETRAIA